jgi:Fur family ferric uptake transcriptional regulator
VAEDWRAKLRAKGYRLTPQRELVLRAVDRLGHATPDEVLTELRNDSHAVNISTVYRSLELLEELGLVHHAHLTDRAPTYHTATTPEHVHVVCRNCHRVTEVAPDVVEPLAGALQGRYGFQTDLGHLTVFGLCADCADT